MTPIPWTPGRQRRLWIAVEAIVVLAVFAGSYRLAVRYLTELDTRTLIEWELKPAAMFACGYGFVEPGGVSSARERFLARRSLSISCSEFAWGGAPTPALGIAEVNRYSIYGAGWAMRVGGVSWEILDAYLAFLFGLSMAAIYGVYRQAVGRVLAVCGVIAVACSTTLVEITVLRDFVKLPCFTVLWLALAWTVRRGLAGGGRALLAPMALGGLLAGLGIGLRMDALIVLPVFVAVAVLAAPGFSRRELGLKAAAVAAFAIMFLVTGGPILRSMSQGSNSSHFLVLGMMRDFDAGLGVESGPYDVGLNYSDGFAYTVITSHGLLKQGARLPVLLGSAEYDRIGSRFVSTMARQFPADVMTRALGATLQVLRFPFDWRIRARAEQVPSFQAQPIVRALAGWRTWILGLVEGREVAIALFTLALSAAFNWRLGVLGLALTLYFCGYSMLQFSRRHEFHLDVVPIFITVLAVQLPLTLTWAIVRRAQENRAAAIAAARGYARALLIGVAALAAAITLAAAALSLARWWQQARVAGVVNATLAATWVPESHAEEPLADTILVGGQPVFTWALIYGEDPDAWKGGTLLRVAGVVPRGTEGSETPDLRQQYFKVTVEDRCAAPNVTVVPQYTGTQHSFDHEYIRSFRIPVGPSGPSHLLVPAYYHLGPTWNRLDGFAVPAGQQGCVTGIERAVDPAALPLPVMAFVLPPQWRERPLYQRVLAVPRVTIIGTPVGPPPEDR